MKNRDKWLVIGISGVTCGGKTTLALRLLASVPNSRVFHQDRYFLPDSHPAHTPCVGLEQPHHNYDILTALDMDQMYKDVVATIEGEDRSHARGPAGGGGGAGGAGAGGGAGGAGRGRGVLIIEGFTALNYPPLYEICDLRYYFTLEYGECFARRALRLYDPPDVPGYFEKCAWPEYQRHLAQICRLPGVTLLAGTDPDVLQRVLQDIHTHTHRTTRPRDDT